MRGSDSPPSLLLRRIREAAGPSVKSALSHTFTRDTRDDPFASTRGSFLKLKQVGSGSLYTLFPSRGGALIHGCLYLAPGVCGVGWRCALYQGGAGRLDLALAWRWLCACSVSNEPSSFTSILLITLAPVMQSASLTARSGFLLPLSSSSSTPPGSSSSSPASAATAVKSLFPDRYHLGGPTSVRHFRLNSLGPKDVGDHLGGDAYYALGASLLTPFRVPALWRNGATRATEGSWWNNENLKGHVWLNAGKLIGTGTRSPRLPSLSLTPLPLLCVY